MIDKEIKQNKEIFKFVYTLRWLLLKTFVIKEALFVDTQKDC